jgi:type II secretory pathway component PulF
LKFHWKGRTRNGQDVEGDTDARLRDEVVARLRTLGITVTEIAEHRSGGEPPDPDQVNRNFHNS